MSNKKCPMSKWDLGLESAEIKSQKDQVGKPGSMPIWTLDISCWTLDISQRSATSRTTTLVMCRPNSAGMYELVP